MKSEAAARQLLRELDEWLKGWGKIRHPVPKGGWIYSVREALGISSAQLGRRLKISQSGVITLEQSEARETMQLATLRRMAKALNCKLVYSLVPENGTLERELEQRRLTLAALALDPLLKGSSLTAAEKRDLIAAYATKIKRKKLWEPLSDYLPHLVREEKKAEGR